MLDRYFSHPTRLKQMRNGPLAKHLDALAERLYAEGYRASSARLILSHIGEFNRTLRWQGIKAQEITSEVLAEYQTHAEGESACRGLANSLDHLLRQLREDGMLPVGVSDESLKPFGELFDGYSRWMRKIQGLAESTILPRVRVADRFLSWWQEKNSAIKLDSMTGGDVLDFIREQHLNRTQVSDLRQFCRYLQSEGILAEDISVSIPSIRRTRLARDPKHIAWEDVERLLETADASTPIGQRDRAVVMLSAQLGLRNREIRYLRLEDLDWRRGVLRVVESKGGKSRELPLPDVTGEVVAEYIRYGRPCSDRHEVFLRHRAPGGVLTTAGAVAGIIRRLARRAGVDLPKQGANVLRHSLATHLVNHDVSIKAISDLLGHASIDTTAIYTLVDMSTLSRVVQPFPKEDAQ